MPMFKSQTGLDTASSQTSWGFAPGKFTRQEDAIGLGALQGELQLRTSFHKQRILKIIPPSAASRTRANFPQMQHPHAGKQGHCNQRQQKHPLSAGLLQTPHRNFGMCLHKQAHNWHTKPDNRRR